MTFPQYSTNPEVQATIVELVSLGCPPIPVAPKQLAPEDPKITGKNPSFLDPWGYALICKHGQFHNQMPSDKELLKFFRNARTGVGTLGGHAGVDWLDVDSKCYSSQADCDADFNRIVENICTHAGCDARSARLPHRTALWIEQTGSNGYRIAVIPQQTPTFTNFATTPGGKHVGEALYKGRFTVLAPSIHPNGNYYKRLEWGKPVEVESLEAIGIYPAATEIVRAQRKAKREHREDTPSNPIVCCEPSHPDDNPWDIRHFSQYFEGYTERGDGWGYAQCPHHANAHSLTSFRVNLATGEYKLWCNCDTKAVWKSGLELAISKGYYPRVRELGEPDSQLYRDYIAWEVEQEQVEKAQVRQSFFSDIQSQLRKLCAPACRVFRGFGTPPPRPTIQTLNYVPGNLPTPAEWNELGRPKIIFQAGTRIAGFREAVQKGWEWVVDTSAPGGGKSHETGLLEIEDMECARIWLMSESHRNPTTAPQEGFYTDMTVRNDGMLRDQSRRTALGNPHVRWPKGDEVPNTGNNCHRTPLFHTLAEKGYVMDRMETAGGEAPNPICASCRFCGICAQQTGIGYGFRAERRAIFGTEQEPGARKIRLHPNSSPDPTDCDLENDASVWDEVMKIFEATSSIDASLQDFDRMWADVECQQPELFSQLRELRFILRSLLARPLRTSLLTGEIPQPRYGWNDAALRTVLPALPPNITEIIGLVSDLMNPSLSELLEDADSVTMDGVEGSNQTRGSEREVLRQTLQMIRSQFGREANRSSRSNIENLPTNWLIPFLEVWAGVRPGALRLKNGKLKITTRNGRHQDLIRTFKFNVFLDATTDPERLALKLGIDEGEILWMEQETPSYTNLTIKHTIDFHQAGKTRADSTDQRILAFIRHLGNLHQNQVAVFDHMTKAGIIGAQGWWFNHTRSSNEFMCCEAFAQRRRSRIASFGIPYKDIGALEDEWLTLTGRSPDNDPEFQRYVDWNTQSEIIQAMRKPPLRERSSPRPLTTRSTHILLLCFLPSRVS